MDSDEDYEHVIVDAIYRHVKHREPRDGLFVRFIKANRYTTYCKGEICDGTMNDSLTFCTDNLDIILALISDEVWQDCRNQFNSSEPLMQECDFDMEDETLQFVIRKYEVIVQNEVITNIHAKQIGYQFAIRVLALSYGSLGSESLRLSMRHHVTEVHDVDGVVDMLRHIVRMEQLPPPPPPRDTHVCRRENALCEDKHITRHPQASTSSDNARTNNRSTQPNIKPQVSIPIQPQRISKSVFKVNELPVYTGINPEEFLYVKRERYNQMNWALCSLVSFWHHMHMLSADNNCTMDSIKAECQSVVEKLSDRNIKLQDNPNTGKIQIQFGKS